MNSATGSIIVLIAWGVTIALVYSMLGGPFEDQRMCQTTCFGMLYWGAIALAVIGTLVSLAQAYDILPDAGILKYAILLHDQPGAGR